MTRLFVEVPSHTEHIEVVLISRFVPAHAQAASLRVYLRDQMPEVYVWLHSHTHTHMTCTYIYNTHTHNFYMYIYIFMRIVDR